MAKRRKRRLTDLDVEEVSLVGKGANLRRFIFAKNEDDGETAYTPADVAEIVRQMAENAGFFDDGRELEISPHEFAQAIVAGLTGASR